jgi:hypothetical protein
MAVRKQTRSVVFTEADPEHERMAAVLVTKDEAGALRAYVKDVPGRAQPDPEIVAALVQSVEIANL